MHFSKRSTVIPWTRQEMQRCFAEFLNCELPRSKKGRNAQARQASRRRRRHRRGSSHKAASPMSNETSSTKARANTVPRISVSAGESNFLAIVWLVRASLKLPPAKHACNPFAPPTPRNHSASPRRSERPDGGLRSLEFGVCRRRNLKMRQAAM